MAGGSRATSTKRVTKEGGKASSQQPPDVYAELLQDAIDSAGELRDPGRPTKKRKTALHRVENSALSIDQQDLHAEPDIPRKKQVTFKDSDTSDNSDVDWQDVGINEESNETKSRDVDINDLTLVLGEDKKFEPATHRRRPTAVEKKTRLEVHKLHILCQLAHVCMRNAWCNDAAVKTHLRKVYLNQRILSYLNPDTDLSQFQRSRSFMDGLQQALDIWKINFQLTAHGQKRPVWSNGSEVVVETTPKDAEEPMGKCEFLEAARACNGSQDVGAQLFCSLLRAAGVDTRLVCSLQVLSFNALPSAPKRQYSKTTVYFNASESEANAETGDEGSRSDTSAHSAMTRNSDQSPKSAMDRDDGPRRIKRFGSTSHGGQRVDQGRPPLLKQPKVIHPTQVPTYWVEAFDTATQKWISVDPISTLSISKPSKLEPPQSSSYDMSYVLALEDDGTVTDVTRRYAKAYNAKTRRKRVEATPGGEKWWKRVIKLFDNGLEADRDQLEMAELAQKEASEPMPRNVQDFKNHPYYALERHLRHNEIIYPKREVGKFSAGKHSASGVEAIYRRRDVQIVRSADKWFRLGRELEAGEHPMRYGKHRNPRSRTLDSPIESATEDNDNVLALYAEFQTQIYVPPPVIDGKVPRNAYGNLDVYVSSMIPKGGIHVRVAEAAKAARILGISYADAVTGFEFKGRQGTAVTQGVVIAADHTEALVAVIEGLWEMQDFNEEMKRSREALKLWKRFMVGLRIRERVMGDGDETMQDVKVGEDDLSDDDEYQEGGFVPYEGQEIVTVPKQTRLASRKFESELDEMTEIPFQRSSRLARTVPHDAIIYPPGTEASRLASPQSSVSASTSKERQKFDVAEPGGLISEIPRTQVFQNEDHESSALQQASRFASTEAVLNDSAHGDSAGGFIVEDDRRDQDRHASNQGSTARSDPTSIENQADSAFLAQSQCRFPDQQVETPPFATDETAIAHSTAIAPPTLEDDVSVLSKKAHSSQNEDSDTTSLLSHDPDDDDAEPEWLENSLQL